MTYAEWLQLLIPVIGIGGSIVTAGFSYYFTKRNQLADANKRIKQDYYMKFIEAWSRRHTSNDKTYVDEAVIAMNNLPLVCSAEVSEHLEKFKEYISNQNRNRIPQVQFEIYTELLKAMRKDLYGSNKVNRNFPVITMQSNFSVDNARKESGHIK